MEQKKKQRTYWLDQDVIQAIEELKDEAGAQNSSDFVRKALEFYIGYLYAQKADDFLTPMLSSALKSETRSLEKNLSEMLFKLAVEVGMSSHITAATNDITESEMDAVRQLCAREVAEINGIISFENAYLFQDGGTHA